jgi:sec-independent protein translocase protein TatB
MFDIAPTELLVCAVIALVVIGPKDLPKALRFVGQWVGKARRMAGTFRTGIDSMMQEAELKEMEEKWRAHNEAIMKAHPQVGVDFMAPDMTPQPPVPATTISLIKPGQDAVTPPRAPVTPPPAGMAEP